MGTHRRHSRHSTENTGSCSGSLREAVKYAPTDARLHHNLSQALAAAQQDPAALAAINRAVELEPGNATYLRARGDVATWTGSYAVAIESFKQVLAVAPQDTDTLLGLARASSRDGKKDAAAARYRAYLKQRPQDKDVMLKYMALETGQGNTAAVQKYDALYRQRFGEGMDYWLRRDRTELSVMMLAKRVIDSPALLRKLKDPWPCRHELRSQVSAAIYRTMAA
jgi:tetratricopeptide (TPR) repeat protein